MKKAIGDIHRSTPESRKETVSSARNSAVMQKVSKLYLKLETLDCEKAKKALNLIEIFSGNIPVVLYDASSGKYSDYRGSSAAPDNKLIYELTAILGEGCVVLK